MGNRGGKAADEIEGKIAAVPEPILHRRAEQPESVHIFKMRWSQPPWRNIMVNIGMKSSNVSSP
jgi:hypothetical protein